MLMAATLLKPATHTVTTINSLVPTVPTRTNLAVTIH